MYLTDCFKSKTKSEDYVSLPGCRKCKNCESDIRTRVLSYLAQFPYIPVNSDQNEHYKIHKLSESEYIKRKNSILNFYNNMIDIMNKTNKSKYNHPVIRTDYN